MRPTFAILTASSSFCDDIELSTYLSSPHVTCNLQIAALQSRDTSAYIRGKCIARKGPTWVVMYNALEYEASISAVVIGGSDATKALSSDQGPHETSQDLTVPTSTAEDAVL